MHGLAHFLSTLRACVALNNMEIPKTTMPTLELTHTMRGFLTGTVHPDALWQFVLGMSGVIGLVIAVFAYLTYTWAESTDAPVVSPPATREMLSADEIHTILEIYRKKNETYRTLLQGHHSPPNLGIDAGVIIPKEVGLGEPAILDTQPSSGPESVP